MPVTENEEKIRKQVLELQEFYKHLLLYGLIVLASILLRVLLNHDYFWPIWIIIIGGTYLGTRAIRLGLLPLVEEVFPFMSPRWVDQEVQRRLEEEKEKNKQAPKSTKQKKPQPAVTPEKIPAASVAKPKGKKTEPAKKTQKKSS